MTVPAAGAMVTRRHALSLGAALGFLLWLVFWAPWSPLASIELGARDYRFRYQAPASRPDPAIVIVDMDDASLDALGEWPWRRRLHAQLIRKLQGWGARAIAFDVTFLEPGPSAPDDLALRQAVLDAGNVVLGGLERDVLTASGQQQVRRVIYEEPIFPAPSGAVAYEPDPSDGTVRAGRLVGPSGAVSLDLAVLRAVDRARAEAVVRSQGEGSYLIRFAGPPGTYPTVSYARVLDGILDHRIDPELTGDADPEIRTYGDFFRDKVVLVGTSAPLLHDMFPTPFARGDRLMAGVEIHANAIDTLRRGDAPRTLPAWAGLAIAVAVGMVAAQVFRYLRPSWGLVGAIGLLAAYAAVNVASFRQGADLPILAPLAVAGLAWPAIYGRRYVATEREKQRIRATFSRYVAPKVVDAMLAHSDQLPALRNERRFITVLFTDIEGFTTFAETHPPDLVADRLNDVLSAITQVVFDHGGTLDKYIGDAVMAIWGNIGESDREADARRAVQAAIAMQREMARLRSRWSAGGGADSLRVRVGIHSGEALVGNFGSPLKLDFTAIGDTVNTASRLEGLNKQFGTAIIVSGATASLVTGLVELRSLGESMLKGKSTGTVVFEVPVAEAEPRAPEGVVT